MEDSYYNYTMVLLMRLNIIKWTIIILVLGAFLTYQIFIVDPQLCHEKNEKYRNKPINAQVERVFIDSLNHMARSLELSDKSGVFILELAIDTSQIWNRVIPGDSLHKSRGENKTLLIKDGHRTPYYVYYACD